jgi:selenobiotic family peptide radical SAM maturase
MTSLVPQDQQERSSRLWSFEDRWESVFPVCRAHVPPDAWRHITETQPEGVSLQGFLTMLSQARDERLPGFLGDLARLEWTVHSLSAAGPVILPEVDAPTINPNLQMVQLSWKGLPALLNGGKGADNESPVAGEEIAVVWRDAPGGPARIQTASAEDLLILKMVVENIEATTVAAAGQLPLGAVEAAIDRAVSTGMILAPRSRIRRDPAVFSIDAGDERFVTSPVFTLQWHITQACDLHCKHCYDRSNRSPLTREQATAVLDDLRTFCRERRVRGQVSFTGGNPLLYPRFTDLYRTAVEQGFAVAILGNPASRQQMEALLAIQRPVFFQVSLEGLQEHNDLIRGAGHFTRVLEFLALLRDLEIPSKVMLTLTRSNVDQVLPLGDVLRDLTDDFTFNRLSMVGEGANLQPPSPEGFSGFLKRYVDASRTNPVMGWKDNFINIVCHQSEMDLFGGCTGYGCGAAFNFMAVLSDGEAHACRKFPSPIGNVYHQTISEIYDSNMAQKYRTGPSACRSCPIHLVCRGCLAVAYSHGLDVFKERDPYCFMATQ